MAPKFKDPGMPDPDKRVERNISIYCRIFEDIVPMHVCVIRKKELNTFGSYSCNGCAVGLAHYWMKVPRKE